MSTRIIRRGKAKEPPIDGEWLRISADVTAEMPVLTSGRDDVLAQVRPALKDPITGKSLDPAPASFHMPTAMVTVDGNYLKDSYGKPIDPESVFPGRYTNRLKYPALWGAVTHEAAHAAHTKWPEQLPEGKPPEGIDRHWIDVAILLEEPRIEHRQLEERGGDRRWLRACTRQIVMDEGGAPSSRGALAKSVILVVGRYIAGVLDESESKSIRDLAVDEFGPDVVDKMEEILWDTMEVEDDNLEAMLDLGRRWVELLGKEDDGTSNESFILMFGEGEGDGDGDGEGEGEGEGDGSKSPMPQSVLDAIAEAVQAVADHDADPGPDPAKEDARKAEAKAKVAAKEAAKVFNSPLVGHGYGAGGGHGTITGYRSPTAAERGGAALLARALRRAVIRERSVIVRTSQRPPGRLRMRDGVAFRASMASGQMPEAEPFTRKIRKHNPSPPLRVGVAQDVSGSQSAFVTPAAIAGWTVARATSLIPEAQFAMVTFGEDVKPVMWPKQAPPGVPQLLAPDGHEVPSSAIRALDGALNLTQPGFARLLFMATDAEFVNAAQAKAAIGDVKRLLDSGCKVIWLATGTGFSGYSRQGSLTQQGVIRIDVSGHPENIGKIIAEAVVKALKE